MPDNPFARAAVRLARFAEPGAPRTSAIADAWQAHRDAGRIGRPVRTKPEIAANRDATARLFARIRRGEPA
ncbi:MAG: hypothetical protein KF730_16280 [Sphingomonas sp.]|uniref:hypothetical protein n=1 Tax=Sphingomonas sp. TaxID=28214 RepID=UPI0025E2266D|nr:hypothetical protein [Sphingomonas sp.]MBX3566118.1 hypothetical protein [Sphingomonas sp.]